MSKKPRTTLIGAHNLADLSTGAVLLAFAQGLLASLSSLPSVDANLAGLNQHLSSLRDADKLQMYSPRHSVPKLNNQELVLLIIETRNRLRALESVCETMESVANKAEKMLDQLKSWRKEQLEPTYADSNVFNEGLLNTLYNPNVVERLEQRIKPGKKAAITLKGVIAVIDQIWTHYLYELVPQSSQLVEADLISNIQIFHKNRSELRKTAFNFQHENWRSKKTRIAGISTSSTSTTAPPLPFNNRASQSISATTTRDTDSHYSSPVRFAGRKESVFVEGRPDLEHGDTLVIHLDNGTEHVLRIDPELQGRLVKAMKRLGLDVEDHRWQNSRESTGDLEGFVLFTPAVPGSPAFERDQVLRKALHNAAKTSQDLLQAADPLLKSLEAAGSWAEFIENPDFPTMRLPYGYGINLQALNQTNGQIQFVRFGD